MFSKNRNISSKIKRSKVTEYAALRPMEKKIIAVLPSNILIIYTMPLVEKVVINGSHFILEQ